MRRRVSRCVLLALLAAFSAVPAAAGTIVGEFFFVRDDSCRSFDPSCQPFEYFNLTNIVDVTAAPSLAGLTFSALIQIDGIEYDDQFTSPAPIGFGEFAMTLGLPATPPFAAAGRASLFFNGGNVADYFGTLTLSNPLRDDASSPSFSATVEFTPNGPVAVTESPSWLVVVIGLGALAVGRALLV